MQFSDDNKTAYVTAQEFAELLEYSCSIPTGQVVGKLWKRDLNFGMPTDEEKWVMGEYFLDGTIPAGEIGIRWRTLVVGEKPTRDPYRHSCLWC